MRQIVSSKTEYVEKILNDKNGRLVRATFCIYEIGGRVKARLVNIEYLEENAVTENKAARISGSVVRNDFECELRFGCPIVSPYFVSNILYFSGSKPRAPAF